MSLSSASVFEFASLMAGRPLYDVYFLSAEGGSIRSSVGMNIETQAFADRVFDTLIVAGGAHVEAASPALLAYVRSSMQTARRMTSICTGAFVLAEAGLLDGRRATTHWGAASRLQSSYPRIKVEHDRIFIVDGSVWTSAGMSAGIDLALAMVEKDHGEDLARQVARQLVVYHRRAGGQSQFSALLEMAPKSDRIQGALAYIRGNLKTNLSIEELAEAAHLSPRQLSRAFRAETGHSPAKAVENLRVEAARMMMEQGRLPTEAVAVEAGFSDPERMRRAFIRVLGQPPQVIRRNARGQSRFAG